MTVASNNVFELPDTIAALPVRPFEFSRAGADEAEALMSLKPDALFHRLLHYQESQSTLLVARRIIHAFLGSAPAPVGSPPPDAGRVAAGSITAGSITGLVAGVRTQLATVIDHLMDVDAETRESIRRQRAPLGLLGGCWLDMVSQPATQPSIIVNRLVAQQFTQRGAGNPRCALHQVRRASLESAGVFLPEIAAGHFLRQAQARPLTALHACFYLALSRLPANFLPEVVGVHYAFHALGVDDLLAGTPPLLPEPLLQETLAEYLTLAAEPERVRLMAAIGLVMALEQEHVAMLAELATWRASLSLESKVAEIVARHAPMAGKQHGGIRIGGRRLAETFSDPELDVAAFIQNFRESPQVLRHNQGSCRFIQAMKFGGPMFGIFDEREAAVFRAFVASAQAGERPAVEISVNRVGDERASHWAQAVARSAPPDIVVAEANPRDHRELFYRLVNIENFPNTLPVATQRAAQLLADAEVLFVHGAAGKYTDATYFDYTPEALFERGERVYWDKLVNPYQPLEQIPDRDEVIFTQTTYALGSLIDGAWIHRIANLGHRDRESDEMLYSIYADEMGHGDLRKNHITLVHRVLASMDITLPHIRDAAFMRQADLPDELYGFSLHQLCMAMFPDTFYNEILGYNFAIEMFGSGEVRLHEMQKLRHYGFDDCYEQAHLAIDNFSAGHTKQAADIIVSYLDGVQRASGDEAVQREWRRIWRGYASFAYFVEHAIMKRVTAQSTAVADNAVVADDTAPWKDPAASDNAVMELVI